ncbi:MAG: hypothetical protein EOM03_14685 [Clostridia bacterium]|nr:hypothetical protein [Clostridia bacterium]
MKKLTAEGLAQLEERRRLYDTGASDAEIAKAQSVTGQAIQQWRKSNNLPANGKRSEKPAVEAQAPAADAATEVSKIFEKQMDKLEECRAAGMIVSEKPWDGEEPDPYVYDGSMTPEDFERRSELLRAAQREERQYMTVEALMKALVNAPQDAKVVCGECNEGFTVAAIEFEYGVDGERKYAGVVLGR